MNQTIAENKFPLLFFVLAFAIAWLFWIPLIFVPALSPFSFIITVCGAFGPTLAAFILSYRKDGIDSVKQLLRRGIDYKIGWKWYIPILLIYPICIFGAFGLAMIISGRSVEFFDINLIGTGIFMLIIMIPIMLPGGPINEEFGWRGYALDRLQAKWNALGSSLILGVIWAVWHLPLFFVDGMSQNLLLVYVPIVAALFFVQVPTFTILYTWLHNNTEGSVFVAILFHAIWNAAFNVLMILIFMQFDLTDPSQISTVDSSTMDSISNLMISSNLILTLALLLVVILVIVKWGVSLRSKSESN